MGTPRSPLKSIPEFFRDWVMSKSIGGGDSIMLRTPPKKLSLDDSNYFNERLKDYKNEFKQNNLPDFEEEIDSRVTSDLDTTVFEADYEKEANLSLDEMSETDKLRNQMFKVCEYGEILKRRLAKLEIENDRNKRNVNLCIFCAVGAIIMSAVVFVRSH